MSTASLHYTFLDSHIGASCVIAFGCMHLPGPPQRVERQVALQPLILSSMSYQQKTASARFSKRSSVPSFGSFVKLEEHTGNVRHLSVTRLQHWHRHHSSPNIVEAWPGGPDEMPPVYRLVRFSFFLICTAELPAVPFGLLWLSSSTLRAHVLARF